MATDQSNLTKAINDNVKNLNRQLTEEEVYNSVLKTAHEKGDLTEIPLYQAGSDFAPYGQSYLAEPRLLGEYLNTVAVKYGLVFIKAGLAQNPLSRFKRGAMPLGGKIESVVFDVIQPKLFNTDWEGSENPWATAFGEAAGNTYVESQDVTSRNTIVDTQDTMHFQNLTQFNNFVYGRITQLVNGMILDEFYQTKHVLSSALAHNLMSIDQATDVKDLGKKILSWSRKFRYFRRDSNAFGFAQATRVEDIEVLMPVDYSVDMDVDFLMNAFNPELFRDTKIHITEVDEFPSIWQYSQDHAVTQDDFNNHYVDPDVYKVGDTIKKGTEAKPNATDAQMVVDGSKIGAIVLDRDALQLWDQLQLTLSSLYNPAKRYTNIFANKKTNLMFVQGLNSKAIMLDGYKPTPVDDLTTTADDK